MPETPGREGMGGDALGLLRLDQAAFLPVTEVTPEAREYLLRLGPDAAPAVARVMTPPRFERGGLLGFSLARGR